MVKGDILKTEKCPYKVYMKLDVNEVRNLCIRNNWYTRGNNEEYTKMLTYCQICSDSNYIDDVLYTIAKDIYSHSNIEDNLSLSDIMYLVGSHCIDIIIRN